MSRSYNKKKPTSVDALAASFAASLRPLVKELVRESLADLLGMRPTESEQGVSEEPKEAPKKLAEIRKNGAPATP